MLAIVSKKLGEEFFSPQLLYIPTLEDSYLPPLFIVQIKRVGDSIYFAGNKSSNVNFIAYLIVKFRESYCSGLLEFSLVFWP